MEKCKHIHKEYYLQPKSNTYEAIVHCKDCGEMLYTVEADEDLVNLFLENVKSKFKGRKGK